MPAEGDDATLACVAVELELPEGQTPHACEERAFVCRAEQLRPVEEAFG